MVGVAVELLGWEGQGIGEKQREEETEEQREGRGERHLTVNQPN